METKTKKEYYVLASFWCPNQGYFKVEAESDIDAKLKLYEGLKTVRDLEIILVSDSPPEDTIVDDKEELEEVVDKPKVH